MFLNIFRDLVHFKQQKSKTHKKFKIIGGHVCDFIFDDSKALLSPPPPYPPPHTSLTVIYIYNITFTICNDVLLHANNLDLCFRYVVIGEKHVKTIATFFKFFLFSFIFLFHLSSFLSLISFNNISNVNNQSVIFLFFFFSKQKGMMNSSLLLSSSFH